MIAIVLGKPESEVCVQAPEAEGEVLISAGALVEACEPGRLEQPP